MIETRLIKTVDNQYDQGEMDNNELQKNEMADFSDICSPVLPFRLHPDEIIKRHRSHA
jgi:hypothetical protein